MGGNALPLAVATAFSIGFLNLILNGPFMAALQARIPAEMQGRVFTLLMSATGVTTPLGLAIAGQVGDTLGVQSWFLISGIVTAVMGVCALLIPAVMQFEYRGDGAVNNPLPISP